MTIFSKTKRFLLISILFLGQTFLFTKPLEAIDSDVSFGVDPLKLEFDLVAEEPVEKEITIYNLSNNEQNYVLSLEKFTISGENGNLKFLKNEEKEIEINFSESNFSIPANTSKVIKINFLGDKNLAQKEYLYMLMITPDIVKDEYPTTASNVTGKIGILTYINFVHSGEILGEDIKSGNIIEFSVKNLINLNSPVKLTARVNNTGNTHYNAYGTIKISNAKGETLDTIIIDKATVLPGAMRTLKTNNGEDLNWEFKYLIGKYFAQLSIKSEDGSINLEKEIKFYIIPLRYIIAGSILITTLVSLLYMYFRYKNFKSP